MYFNKAGSFISISILALGFCWSVDAVADMNSRSIRDSIRDDLASRTVAVAKRLSVRTWDAAPLQRGVYGFFQTLEVFDDSEAEVPDPFFDRYRHVFSAMGLIEADLYSERKENAPLSDLGYTYGIWSRGEQSIRATAATIGSAASLFGIRHSYPGSPSKFAGAFAFTTNGPKVDCFFLPAGYFSLAELPFQTTAKRISFSAFGRHLESAASLMLSHLGPVVLDLSMANPDYETAVSLHLGHILANAQPKTILVQPALDVFNDNQILPTADSLEPTATTLVLDKGYNVAIAGEKTWLALKVIHTESGRPFIELYSAPGKLAVAKNGGGEFAYGNTDKPFE